MREKMDQIGFTTVAEAAEFLAVSRPHVYVLMDRGDLPFVRFGRCRRIPRRALHDFVSVALRGEDRRAALGDERLS